MEEFRRKFQLDRLTVREYETWIVSVRPSQPTIASLVLSLRRPCDRLGSLQPAEATELAGVFGEIEGALDRTFQPDRINYLALMMVDAHVHFHVVPRYAEARVLEGRPYRDASWPGPPDLTGQPLAPGHIDAIREILRSAFEPSARG